MAQDEKESKRPRTVRAHVENIRWLFRNPDRRGPKKSMEKAYPVDSNLSTNVERSEVDKAAEDKAIADFVKDSRINDATVRKLLNGEGVYPATVQKIATLFDVSVVDLVDFKIVELPSSESDYDFYTKLHLSFYIDNNRNTTGSPEWYFERLDLRRDDETTAGKCSYTGWIRNQFGNVFKVKAFLMDRHLFSILCTSENADHQLSFSASFTRLIRLHGADQDAGETFSALEGTWCGIDHLGRNAVYRMFICETGVINCADLKGLTPIKVLETASMGYAPRDVPGKLDSLGEESKEKAAAGKPPVDNPAGRSPKATRRKTK